MIGSNHIKTVIQQGFPKGILNSWIEQDYVAEGPLVAAPDNAMHYRVGAMKSFDPADVTISSMVSDICTRAGLTAGQPAFSAGSSV